MHFAPIVLLLTALPAFATLLQNGDFEKGLEGWSTGHGWYEKPAGAGASEITVADGEGHEGSKALKIEGQGKRGIAMQVFGAYPGKYRISGMIKCERLTDGQATVLAEWMSGDNTWISGTPAASARGTADWRRFETVVEAPDKTRSVHFDLLTSEPNSGVAWFDELEMVRIAGDVPKPQAPALQAETPEGQEGCLRVSWDPGALVQATVRIMVYCEADEPRSVGKVLPTAVFDADEGQGTVQSLDTGSSYHLAAVAVNAEGDVSPLGQTTRATVSDRQAPRPGSVEAFATDAGTVGVDWTPHVLDADVATVHVCIREGEAERGRQVLVVPVGGVYDEPRPLYCTQAWLSIPTSIPATASEVGLWCEDQSGNAGPVAWAKVRPRPASTAGAPCATWVMPPTAQLKQDAERPAAAADTVDLELMPGQSKGVQLLMRPQAELHGVRARFSPLKSDAGGEIDARWLAYHFVNYAQLEKNSRATPAEELLWPAPAGYPDELDDALTRDLPAGTTQPIYLRIGAPRGAPAGTYRGQALLTCDEGVKAIDITVRVSSVELSQRPRLKFVYWSSWGDPCKQFGVEQYSADGWRVLSKLAELMRVHHQNVIVVPWSLVRTWQRPDGSLAHDFSIFDRFIRTCQSQGVDALFCLSHFGGRTTGQWECPTMRSHGASVRALPTGETKQIDSLEVLPGLQEHIAKLGLIDRFCVHVADEPIPVNLDSYRELSARVKEKAPLLRRIDAVHVPNLQGALEIWVPQLNYFERWLDEYRAAQKAGNEIWFYVAWVPQGKHPNRMIDSQAIKSRVLHWLNGIYDTSGYLHWALNRWGIDLMSLQSPGDQYICWPSQRYIADSSLRYEAEREGLEDCELMFMLRDALQGQGLTRDEAQAEVERIARKAVRGFQDYTRSWQELEAVRHELLMRLEKARQADQ